MMRRLDLFLDNAVLAKDYRVLLRSPRVMVFACLALGLISVIAASMYSSMFEPGRSMTPSQAQGQLLSFYNTITVMVNVMVLLVAPVLAASSVVGQTSRMNLELVMVGPRSLSYLLLGTLMSVYRQLVLVLAITLPISAVGVMLGGVTWQSLFTNYFLISLQGLLVASCSLFVGLRQKNLVATLITTFGLTLLVSLFSGFLALTSGLGGGSASNPFAGLTPFLVQFSPRGDVPFFGLAIPDWLFCAVVAFLLARVVVGAAEAQMTRAGSRENVRSRWVTVVALVGLFAYLLLGAGLVSGSTPVPIPRSQNPISYLDLVFAAQWPMLLVFTLPIFGFFESRKELVPVKSVFSRAAFKEAFSARGEGNVAFAGLILLLCTVALGFSIARISTDVTTDVAVMTYTTAFWLHLLAASWLGSGLGRTSVTGRVLPWLVVVILVAAGNGGVATLQAYLEGVFGLRYDLLGFFPWNPANDAPVVVIGKAAFLFVIAVVFFLVGERARQRRLAEGWSPI